jgi:integrase
VTLDTAVKPALEVPAPATGTLSLTHETHAATTLAATKPARKSRKRLNRRTGQDPSVTFYFTKDGRRMGRIIYWTDVAGQAERVQRSKSLGDLTDLSAEQIEKKRKKAIAELGIYNPAVDNVPSPDSFAEKAADWMETEMLKNRDPYNQRYHVKSFLLPAFGKLPLDCVTAEVVNAWLGKVKRSNGERYGKNTLKHAVSTLKQIVSPRLDNANMKCPADAKPEEETYCPTDDEVKAMVMNSYGWFHTLIRVLAETGMRSCEALALRVEDIDPVYNVIHIRRGTRNGKIGRTKTNNSRRVISVHESLIQEILHLADRTEGLIFHTENNTPYMLSNIHDDFWQPMLERAKLAEKAKQHFGHFGFHLLRHFSVSYCIRSGMQFDDVKLRHGHGSERIMKRYMHLAPGYDKRTLAHVPDLSGVTSVVTIARTENAA